MVQTMHELFVPGVVRGQGSLTLWRGDDGKERAKHPQHTVEWRNQVCGRLAEWWNDWPPIRGPVKVGVIALYARPKGHYGTGKNAALIKGSSPKFHTGFPDLDKVIRLIDDALTIAGVIADDSQVSVVYGRKMYCKIDEKPGALITVEEL